MTMKTAVKKGRAKRGMEPLFIAGILIILGLIGLALALSRVAKESARTTGDDLMVTESNGQTTGAGASQSGQQLQNAARTQDLIQGEEGSDVQPGASTEQLLKDKELK